jgi:hypothetical protein
VKGTSLLLPWVNSCICKQSISGEQGEISQISKELQALWFWRLRVERPIAIVGSIYCLCGSVADSIYSLCLISSRRCVLSMAAQMVPLSRRRSLSAREVSRRLIFVRGGFLLRSWSLEASSKVLFFILIRSRFHAVRLVVVLTLVHWSIPGRSRFPRASPLLVSSSRAIKGDIGRLNKFMPIWPIWRQRPIWCQQINSNWPHKRASWINRASCDIFFLNTTQEIADDAVQRLEPIAGRFCRSAHTLLMDAPSSAAKAARA